MIPQKPFGEAKTSPKALFRRGFCVDPKDGLRPGASPHHETIFERQSQAVLAVHLDHLQPVESVWRRTVQTAKGRFGRAGLRDGPAATMTGTICGLQSLQSVFYTLWRDRRDLTKQRRRQ